MIREDERMKGDVTPLMLPKRFYATKGKRGKRKFVEPVVVKHIKSTKEVVDLYDDMTARELSEVLNVDLDVVAESLIDMDKQNLEIIGEDKPIDKEYLIKTAALFDCKPRFVARPRKKDAESDDVLPQPPPHPSECISRPPVVTIMGHVDHGKTTLLDALRNSHIVAGEFGGITQHIGAFSVDLKGVGRRVTFLDTPGHAAFAAMRARGAKGADIVVLVVAADDGVKEQTVQSIKFAQSAGAPIVVAINKCDKPTADPMRAKRSLMEHHVVVEELGGDVQCVEISALHAKNLPALQEALLMQSDLMGLKSTPKGLAEGVVIESSVVHGIGKVCTVVVTRGTLRKNAILVAGGAWSRVRTMTDENGRNLQEAGPSTPVRVSGWKEDIPMPGELILEVESMDRAQRAVKYRADKEMAEKAEKDWEAIEERRREEREKYLANRQKLLDKGYRYGSTLRQVVHKEKRLEKPKDDGFPRLHLLLRADVEGTLEAILNVIDTYDSEKCKFQLVDFGIGPPTIADLEMAKEAEALIYLFNVQPPTAIRTQAEQDGIRIEQFNVIYRLVEALKDELSRTLPKLTELELVGEGHVLKEFLISDRNRKKQPIAGVLVDWGNFQRDCIFKFLRAGKPFYEGEVESMKHQTEMVSSATTNTEVGLALGDKSVRFKEDDSVEVYIKKEVPQTIDWNPPGF
ncbi:unnamed protein product [Haemonchus placei]|uniref:Tr-type G domain-containing protein n=1 Tax=Haemonchus placei TaxID=6290 RepID=A0A0N4WEC9_HAEPC|nr:unnamed protein product [Haemonchus placei]